MIRKKHFCCYFCPLASATETEKETTDSASCDDVSPAAVSDSNVVHKQTAQTETGVDTAEACTEQSATAAEVTRTSEQAQPGDNNTIPAVFAETEKQPFPGK